MDDDLRNSDLVKSVIATIVGSEGDKHFLTSSLRPEEEQRLQEELLARLHQESDEQRRFEIIKTLVELGDNRVWIHPESQRWLQRNFTSLDVRNLSYSPELLEVISKTLTGATDAETKSKLIISLGHWSEELCWQIHSPDRDKFYSWSEKWLNALKPEDIHAVLEDNSFTLAKKIEFILSLGKLPLNAALMTELLNIMTSETYSPELQHSALIALLHQSELSEDIQKFVTQYLLENKWEDVESFLTKYCPMHCYDCLANGVAALDEIPSGLERIIMKLIQKSSGFTGDLLLNQLECLLYHATRSSSLVPDLEKIVLDAELPSRTRHRALLILGSYFMDEVDWEQMIEKIQQENDPTLVSSLIHVLASHDGINIDFFNKFLRHENFIVRNEAENAIAKKQ